MAQRRRRADGLQKHSSRRWLSQMPSMVCKTIRAGSVSDGKPSVAQASGSYRFGYNCLMTHYALSLKQPWAALLVHGLKTIEVRRWRTKHRGRLLIHAARVPDDRAEAWAHVPKEWLETAQLLGGIIGAGELTDLRTYRGPEEFRADQRYHLNEPSWFQPPQLHGFVFTHLSVLPFVPFPGKTRLFKMEWDESEGALTDCSYDEVCAGPRTQLLVSVRNAGEVEAAVAGGADLIDVKEPELGSLGPPTREILAKVVAEVAGRRPVSAAMGELLDSFWKEPIVLPGLTYAKWGLAGFQRHAPLVWRWELDFAAKRLAEVNPECRAVAVAYADWKRAQAPSPRDVLSLATRLRLGAFLLDTWQKDGATLLDWLSLGEIQLLRIQCRSAGIPIALAGSLGETEIQTLLPLRPDWFAVRGAVCQGRQRGGVIDEGKVRQLVEMIHPATPAN